MIEFNVGGVDYRAVKLPPLKQLKIARRLIVALGKLAHPAVLPLVNAMKDGQGVASITAEQVTAILPVLMDAVQSLSDEDCDVVVITALSAVSRKHLASGGWQPLIAVHGGQSVIAFDDITLSTMLQVAFKVVEDSLGSFFDASPPGSNGLVAGAV